MGDVKVLAQTDMSAYDPGEMWEGGDSDSRGRCNAKKDSKIPTFLPVDYLRASLASPPVLMKRR